MARFELNCFVTGKKTINDYYRLFYMFSESFVINSNSLLDCYHTLHFESWSVKKILAEFVAIKNLSSKVLVTTQ